MVLPLLHFLRAQETVARKDDLNGCYHCQGGDDERAEIHKRFRAEGLETSMPDSKKLIHVWHWLIDAETNCNSLRHQLDKLHKQQLGEMKEVETYIEHIHELFEEKVTKVQNENRKLRKELEHKFPSEVTLKEIRAMLLQEGLNDILQMNLSEQVGYILAERARLKDQLEGEQEKHRRREQSWKVSNNLPDSLKLTVPDIMVDIDSGSDCEDEPVTPSMRRKSRTYSDNDTVKLEEELEVAKKKISDLLEVVANPDCLKNGMQKSWINNLLEGHAGQDIQEILAEQDRLRNKVSSLQDKVRTLNERLLMAEKTNRQLELDNETLAYKLSEALSQYDELEDQLRTEKLKPRRESVSKSKFPTDSPTKLDFLHSLFDNRVNMAQQDLALMEHVKKLQKEIVSLQNQLTSTGHKLEILTVKYQQRKVRHRERMYKLKDHMDREQRRLKDKAETLNRELNMVKETLKKEHEWKLRIENDCKSLQEEKRKLMASLMDKEEELKEKTRDLRILQTQFRKHEALLNGNAAGDEVPRRASEPAVTGKLAYMSQKIFKL